MTDTEKDTRSKTTMQKVTNSPVFGWVALIVGTCLVFVVAYFLKP